MKLPVSFLDLVAGEAGAETKKELFILLKHLLYKKRTVENCLRNPHFIIDVLYVMKKEINHFEG